MISMKLELGGLFDNGSLASLARNFGKDVSSGVAAGMKSGGKAVLGQVRAAYARSVNARRKNFSNIMGMKVYDKKKDEFPALLIGTRSPMVAAHAFGADIPGPVLIPLLDNGERIGRKAFALLIRGLVRSGNAEFRRVNGRTIVFAEAGAAAQSGLNIGKFRRAERLRRGGSFRKPRGRALDVPIAVLVRNVHVRAVFPFGASVRSGLPMITAAIQTQLDKV
jgi:hypothetical protein